jgi:hypothetical protein
LSSPGIKVPCRKRTLGEQIVQTEEKLHGNQEESRQEKETLSGRMLVQKFRQPLRRSTS